MVFGWIKSREHILPILHQVIYLVMGDRGSSQGGVVDFYYIGEKFLRFTPVTSVPDRVDLLYDLSN